jgi:hypothetical protein
LIKNRLASSEASRFLNQSQVRKPKPKTVTVALLYSAGRGADDIRLRAYFSKCPREARYCWRWGIAAQWAMLAVALGCIQTLASGVWMAGSSLGHDGMNLWVILFGIWYYAIVHQCKIICVCVLAVPVDKTTSMATAIIPFLILRPYGVRPAATPQV